MEKRLPHCQLNVVKVMVGEGKVRATYAAVASAAGLEMDFNAMLAVVLALTHADFYKSMTTHADHRVWQDVYRPMTSAGRVYLKLTVTEGVLIVSFKAL